MLMRCMIAVQGKNVEFFKRMLKLLHSVISKTPQLVPDSLR